MVGVGLLALHLFDQTYVFDEVNSKHRGTEDTEAFNSTRTIYLLKNRKLVRSHGWQVNNVPKRCTQKC